MHHHLMPVEILCRKMIHRKSSPISLFILSLQCRLFILVCISVFFVFLFVFLQEDNTSQVLFFSLVLFNSSLANFPAVFFIFAALIFVMKHNRQLQKPTDEIKSQLSYSTWAGESTNPSLHCSAIICQLDQIHIISVWSGLLDTGSTPTVKSRKGVLKMLTFLLDSCKLKSILLAVEPESED